MERINIAILLSTYNGAKFLGEQLESIRKQTNQIWQLYIRDDGSSDDTVAIIKDYCRKDKRIHWINEFKQQNVGVKESFIRLLIHVQADYYVFCDQDDFWLPNKVQLTFDGMDLKFKKPQLVFTDLRLVDESLQELNSSALRHVDVNRWIEPNNLFFDNVVTGCTVMINDALKQVAVPVVAGEIVMHDWWLALLATQMGRVKYIEQATILYRQHSGNQVGINASVASKLKKIHEFRKFGQEVYLQLRQNEIAVNRSGFKLNSKASLFLSILNTSSLVKRLWIVARGGFKKHTFAGTLALNLALVLMWNNRNQEV